MRVDLPVQEAVFVGEILNLREPLAVFLLDQLLHQLARLGGHAVELPRQHADLVAALHRGAHVQLARLDPAHGVHQAADLPGHLPADGDGDDQPEEHAQQRRDHAAAQDGGLQRLHALHRQEADGREALLFEAADGVGRVAHLRGALIAGEQRLRGPGQQRDVLPAADDHVSVLAEEEHGAAQLAVVAAHADQLALLHACAHLADAAQRRGVVHVAQQPDVAALRAHPLRLSVAVLLIRRIGEQRAALRGRARGEGIAADDDAAVQPHGDVVVRRVQVDHLAQAVDEVDAVLLVERALAAHAAHLPGGAGADAHGIEVAFGALHGVGEVDEHLLGQLHEAGRARLEHLTRGLRGDHRRDGDDDEQHDAQVRDEQLDAIGEVEELPDECLHGCHRLTA